MSVTALVRVTRESINELLASTEAGILSGVRSWDEYNKLCGKRQGLQQALQELNDNATKLEQQD